MKELEQRVLDTFAEVAAMHAAEKHPEMAVDPNCPACKGMTEGMLHFFSVLMGIPAEHMPKIVEKFDFTNSARTFNEKGTLR